MKRAQPITAQGVLVIILLLLPGYDVFSAIPMPITPSDTILIARKGKKEFKYKMGKFVSIRHNNLSEKISGQIIKVSSDSVFLLNNPDEYISGKKYNSDMYAVSKIAIRDIHSISILHKKGRKNWEKTLLILFILLGIGLLVIDRLVAIGILLVGTSSVGIYYLIPFYLINFLSDILSTKSIRKGWKFDPQKTEIKTNR